MNGRLLSPPSRWGTIRRALGLWLAVFLTFGSPWAWAANYYVDQVNGNDSKNGKSIPQAWKTLTHALSSVVSGDVINVLPGLYDRTVNGENFPLALVDGVKVASTAGPAVTTIQGDASSVLFLNNGPLSATTQLSGFQFNNSNTSSNFDADIIDFEVMAAAMAPTIDSNQFTATVPSSSRAILIHDASAAAGQFTGLIQLNTFTSLYGAIALHQSMGGVDTFSPRIQQNTFTTNGRAIQLWLRSPAGGTQAPLITNNTFTNSSFYDLSISVSARAPFTSFAPTISNNTSTNTGSAPFVSMSVSLSTGTYDIAPTIINNGSMTTPLQGNINIQGNGISANIGTKNFTPTISGNTITQSGSTGISISLTELDVTGGIFNFAPVVDGNTITNERVGIGVNLTLTGAHNTAQVTFSPTISNNTIKSASFAGIDNSLSAYFVNGTAKLTASPLITQNSITTVTSGNGLSVSVSISASSSATATATPAVTNNAIDGTSSDGIHFRISLSASTNAQVTGMPTITGNSITNAGGDGIDISKASLSVSDTAQGTLSPTISGNTISTVGGRGIFMSASVSGNALLVGPPPAKATFSPTVSNNTISGTGTEGIELAWSFSGTANASLISNASITGNRITSPGGNGISISLSMRDWKNINQSLSIANNTISGALGIGLEFVADELSNNATGNSNLSITGNQITGSAGNGADLFLGSWGTSKANQSILIDGNTITNSSGTNLNFDAGSQSSLATNDIRITNNNFSSGNIGASIRSDRWKPGGVPTNAVLFSCNTVTNNLADGVIQRVVTGPPADYGGGDRSSPGGNRLFSNGGGSGLYDFKNLDDATVQAQKNWWGTTNSATIDSHIFDDEENPGISGDVNFTPFKLANSGCVNNPPIANNDAYSTNQGTPLIVAAPGVLANDTDADGDPLTAVLMSAPSNGTVTLNSNGSFTYTPNPAFTGADAFTYVANDGTANSNVATVTITVVAVGSADVSVTKIGPLSYTPGGRIIYTITVTNNGPSSAANVQLNDVTPADLTLVAVTGACTSFPCALGTMTAGQTATTTATYTVRSGASAPIVNTATVSSTTGDSNPGNNSSSFTSRLTCPPSAPTNLSPANGQRDVALSGFLSWTTVGAASYTVYLDVQGGSCSKFLGSVASNSIQYAGLLPGTTYQWHVDAVSPGCPTKSTSCVTFTTTIPCPTTAPTLISPVSGDVTGQATFTWSAVPGAVDYKLFVNSKLITTTISRTFGPVSVGNGPVSWFVIAEFAPPCAALQSEIATFNICDTSGTTIPSLVAESASGEGYDLTFDPITGALRYEVDESIDPNFAPGTFTTQTVTTNSAHYLHSVSVPTAFYYRVRAIYACGTGANSVTVRVVLAPAVVLTNPNVGAPVGSKVLVPIPVHIPGFAGQSFSFTATLDNKPWLIRVEPNSGLLPPEGVDLVAFADPSGLPNGTFTGTVIVSVSTPVAGPITTNGITPISAPVSISLVTPIKPLPAAATPAGDALIISSVGHLDGINSKWVSNVRVANITSSSAKYQLTFIPDDPSRGVKQTIINVSSGATTALDDIVKTWYGVGALGENGGGALVVQSVTFGKGAPSPDDVSVPFAVVTSHTFNQTPTGTVGQYIAPVRFSNFVGRAIDSNHAATILSVQQIAQSNVFRTNFALLEGSGQPVSVLVSAYDSAGNKVLEVPVELRANEQRHFNSFLAQNKISLSDGRLEARVTSGEGKITAYASVVDNVSGDPYLVPAVPLGQDAFDHFVLAGVANLTSASGAWQTDVDAFNPGTTAQSATLTFFPLGNSGSPQTAAVTINPSEVKRLENVLHSVFGVSNTGGAIHVTTTTPSPLVITSRTSNVTAIGSFGQFAPAFTAADAVGKNDRALQILQAEDSVRYRTQVGIAEVTGNPATVEVQVFLPDSKVSPSTQIPLPANGFIQVPVIQSLGLTNIYNARISLRVVGGNGKVSAYGSVIDQVTSDPAYVPAR